MIEKQIWNFFGSGGKGKSTLSANIATCAAVYNGLEVLLVDGDSQPTQQILFENYKSNGKSLGDFITRIKHVDMIPITPVEGVDRVDVSQLLEYCNLKRNEIMSRRLHLAGFDEKEDKYMSSARAHNFKEAICKSHLLDVITQTKCPNLHVLFNPRGSDNAPNLDTDLEKRIINYIRAIDLDLIVVDSKAGNDYHVSNWFNIADNNIVVGHSDNSQDVGRIISAIISLQGNKSKESLNKLDMKYAECVKDLKKKLDMKTFRAAYDECFINFFKNVEAHFEEKVKLSEDEWKIRQKIDVIDSYIGNVGTESVDLSSTAESFWNVYKEDSEMRSLELPQAVVFENLKKSLSQKIIILMNALGNELTNDREAKKASVNRANEVMNLVNNYMAPLKVEYPTIKTRKGEEPLFLFYEPRIIGSAREEGIPFVVKYPKSESTKNIKEITKYLLEAGERK